MRLTKSRRLPPSAAEHAASRRYPFGVRRDFLFWGGGEIPVKRDQDLEHVEQVKYNIDRARSKATQLREMGLMHKIPV